MPGTLLDSLHTWSYLILTSTGNSEHFYFKYEKTAQRVCTAGCRTQHGQILEPGPPDAGPCSHSLSLDSLPLRTPQLRSLSSLSFFSHPVLLLRDGTWARESCMSEIFWLSLALELSNSTSNKQTNNHQKKPHKSENQQWSGEVIFICLLVFQFLPLQSLVSSIEEKTKQLTLEESHRQIQLRERSMCESLFSEGKAPVLVSLGCCSRMPQTGWPKQQTFLSHSSGGWEGHDQGPGRLTPGGGGLSCRGCLLAVLRWWKEGALVWLPLLTGEPIASYLRSPNLMTSPKPDYLPEAPPPNNITVGVRASTYEFGKDANYSAHNSSHGWFQ